MAEEEPKLRVMPVPECPEHGPMSLAAAERFLVGANVLVWVCHGFDGEGCDYTVMP